MTLRNWSQLVQQTTKGFNSHRAFGFVYAGEVGKNLDPLHVEGWCSLGLPTTLPKFTETVEKEQIKAGLPGGLLINLPTMFTSEQEFVFNHFNLTTQKLASANTVEFEIRYATGSGQTTIASGASRTGATVATGDGADFAVGDWVHVECKHATYGGFNDVTQITSVTGDVLTWEPLPVAPTKTGAFVKKIAGKTTGTNKTDIGIKIPRASKLAFPRVQLLTVFNLPGSRSLMVVHQPEFEITEGNPIPDFSAALATVGFKGNPILQAEKSFTLDNGDTVSLPWYDDLYIVPLES